MKAEEKIRELAGRAVAAPPAVDVADRVMATIHALSAAPSPLAPPGWLAVAAVAAAVPVAVSAWLTLEVWTDPLLVMLGELPWGTL